MNENILNVWLQIKSFIRFVFSVKPNLRKPDDVSKYRLIFSDFFIGDNLNFDKWSEGHSWGEFHPSFPYQYYGKGKDFIDVKDNCLNLYTRYKPKKFIESNKTEININYGIGLVTSRQNFKYGYYEINCILPSGKLLWPAIWLTAVKTWPPEIDLLEAYSGKKSDYRNKLGIPFVKFEPNIHYGFVENKTKKNYGAKIYPIPNNPTERPTTFSLHWTESFIKFYYDGYLVFKTEKKKILDYFNQEDVNMKIILNNGYHPSVDGTEYEDSIFKINYVKFFSKI